jgi:hypothetical protein
MADLWIGKMVFWFTTNAFAVDKRLRRLFRFLPHDPRCKFCNAPFQGVGGIIVSYSERAFGLKPRVLFVTGCARVPWSRS